MRYLHIIQPSKRMLNTYISLIREFFNEDDHMFYSIAKFPQSEKSLFEYGNVKEMQGKNRWEKIKDFYKTLKSADAIIWHGFIFPSRHMIFCYFFRGILKKSTWIMWGIDLYNWKREENSIKNIFLNYIDKRCREIVPIVIALLEPDKDVFEKQFPKKKGKCIVVPYPISRESFSEMERLRNSAERPNGKIFIQVAHNAHTFNNHLSILEKLEKFNDKNILLFLPLSYGNDWHNGKNSYVNEIKTYGNNNFKHKIHYIQRLMPQSEYTNFLCNMDIAIFNAERQNALGNILKLLYIGNKVFMSAKSPIYEYLQKLGIQVFDVEDINSMDFDEFITKSDQTEAVEWIIKNYYPEATVGRWRAAFKLMAGEKIEVSEENININTIIPQEGNCLKSNYLCLSQYKIYNNKKKSRYFTIIGAGNFTMKCLQWCFDLNIPNTNCHIRGIIDDNNKSLNYTDTDIDIIGSIADLDCEQLENSNELIICTVDNTYEREMIVKSLLEKDIWLDDFRAQDATVSYGCEIGQGCIFGKGTYIMPKAKIGDFVIIETSVIGSNSEVGDYSNIYHSCAIGENVTIGKNVTINPCVTIASNVSICDGTNIPSGKTITNNI